MAKHTPNDLHIAALRGALTYWTVADRDYVVNAYRAHDALVSALEMCREVVANTDTGATRHTRETIDFALKLAKGE